MGSEDGFGIFNWRMKFPLSMPCTFPRLRFVLMDLNTVGSDNVIGEASVSINKLLKTLATDGRVETPPQKI